MNVGRVVLWGPLLVFVAAALWATDAPFRAHLTQELSSSFIVLAEHAISLLVALPILLLNWRDVKKLSVREWFAVGAIALGGSALASIAFTQSFHYVNPSVAILLQKVQPLIVITLAALLLHEKPRTRFWLWALMAMAGAYLVTFPHITPQLYDGETFNPNMLGVGLALFAALLWGASTVCGKYMLRTTAFQMVTSLRFALAFVFLLLLNTWQGTLSAVGAMTSMDILFIIIVAVASGVFSLFLYYYGLQYTRASVATIAELGFPLAAVFVNAYFIPGANVAGGYFGLFAGQWVGTALLLFALYMLSRENQQVVQDATRV